MNNRVIDSNCLNTIRLLAALQVLGGHITDFIYHDVSDIIRKAIMFPLGVPIFFVMSGYLIWYSLQKSKSVKQFARKRFWRIYPELWVAVFFEVLVMIILYHDWNLKSLLLFIFCQGTLFQFWTPDCLRGYGVGSPNGALWTIGIMIQFYIIAYLFYEVMKRRRFRTWVFVFVLSICISYCGQFFLEKIVKNELLVKLYGQTIIRYFWLFVFGMLIAEFSYKVLPILKKVWWALIAVAFLFYCTGWDLDVGYSLFWSLFLSAGLIGFAYQNPRYNIPVDISYALFLYHMIIVNLFVSINLVGEGWHVLAVVLLSVALAYVSTNTIGKLSLRKKQNAVLNS